MIKSILIILTLAIGIAGAFAGFSMLSIGLMTVALSMMHAQDESELILLPGYDIDHRVRFTIRVLIASVIAFVVEEGNVINALALTVYEGCVFWISFDIWLNLYRDKKWNYISTYYQTAWLDRIFKGKWKMWMAVKAVLFIGSILVYLWIS